MPILFILMNCRYINYNYKSYINKKDEYGWTALMKASHRGDIDLVKLLIKDSADVNIGNKSFSPIYLAAQKGHVEVFKLLMKEGADLNYRRTKWEIMTIAIKKGYKEIVEILIHKFDNFDVLHDKAIDIFLHKAIKNGREDIVNILIINGANVNSRINCKIPLDIAIKNGREDIANILVNNGAKIENSVLKSCIKASNIEILKILLSNTYCIDVKYDYWEREHPLLKYASLNSNSEIIKLIIDRDFELKQGFASFVLMNDIAKESSKHLSFIVEALNKSKDYYNNLNTFNLFNLELAMCRLKNPLIFEKHFNFRDLFYKSTESIVLYIARSSRNLVIKHNNNIDRIKYQKQADLIRDVYIGVRIITSFEDDNFLINYPDIFENIIYQFKPWKWNKRNF